MKKVSGSSPDAAAVRDRSSTRMSDGWTLCVLCGREPSVRLPVSVSRNGTRQALNGAGRATTPAWARPASPSVQLALF